MCPIACTATAVPAGCCHAPGEGMGAGMRNKDRDGATEAGGSFSKLWLMGTLLW